ncbi:hypothetical protein [Thiolapillus sp.]
MSLSASVSSDDRRRLQRLGMPTDYRIKSALLARADISTGRGKLPSFLFYINRLSRFCFGCILPPCILFRKIPLSGETDKPAKTLFSANTQQRRTGCKIQTPFGMRFALLLARSEPRSCLDHTGFRQMELREGNGFGASLT